ncbi:MAG: hypothetical protein CME06_16805 [Gemmatimonadetes bacterium]|nr:hypothetical protein [Gemmatimonadota bacterium]
MRSAIFLTALAIAAPAPAQLVINEIMPNPVLVIDPLGEWFELYNSSPDSINIEGYIFSDNDGDSFEVSTPVWIEPGDYAVLGASADTLLNGGVEIDYAYSGQMTLQTASDELVVFAPGLGELDRVEWDGGPSFPAPVGASMSLLNPGLDNSVGENWFEATILRYNAIDVGTPGIDNEPIVWITTDDAPEMVYRPGPLSFTVQLVNPTWVGADFDAWLNVVGPGGIDTDVLSYLNLSLAPGDTALAQVVLPIPPLAPDGTYTLSTRLGAFPPSQTIWWHNAFVTTLGTLAGHDPTEDSH